jgi:hypothetical protein
VYTNSNLDNWEKQKIITNKISIFDHWTLPNNKLSYSVIEKYMDYKKFIESTSYEQNVLDDIENCTTPYMICGVH